jgi:hypothetical protein
MAEAFRIVSWGETRGFTNALLDSVEEGSLKADKLLETLLLWMGEYEVECFCLRSPDMRDEDNEPIVRRETDSDDEEGAE